MMFTTSWDDGYAGDIRIAEILERYGATGTFYASPQPQHERPMLSATQLKDLGARHEVGAHTITHPRLTRIDSARAAAEILDSKRWVEDLTGRPCAMFCYPYGDENGAIRRTVRDAGFRGARTVVTYRFTSDDPFAMPTSLHLYPFPWRPRYTNRWHLLDPLGPLRAQWKNMNECRIPLVARRSWQALARALFLHALRTSQPFFHLWGHAYELDRYGLWEELDAFLAFVARHPVEHRTNGRLAAILHYEA